jgi:protein translocase SecG subunit
VNLTFAAAALAARPSVAPAVQPSLSPAQLPLQMPPVAQPLTWWQQHTGWLTHGVAGIFVFCAIALIVLLAVQTTKQEGLSGSIGGRVESAYRGRLGADEQLKRLTGWVAVGFCAAAFILTITGI